jgi:stage III sporulation protein AG
LLVVGVGLLVFNSVCSPGGKNGASTRYEIAQPETGYREEQQVIAELAAVLNQIRGVSNVRIYLTVESSGLAEAVADQEKTRRLTEESDSGGGRRVVDEETLRLTYVKLRDAQGREAPLIIRQAQPRYRGVLVVADGVGDPAVKARVVEALQAVLNLPSHRITVLPRG